jgi:hypothetical protein
MRRYGFTADSIAWAPLADCAIKRIGGGGDVTTTRRGWCDPSREGGKIWTRGMDRDWDHYHQIYGWTWVCNGCYQGSQRLAAVVHLVGCWVRVVERRTAQEATNDGETH